MGWRKVTAELHPNRACGIESVPTPLAWTIVIRVSGITVLKGCLDPRPYGAAHTHVRNVEAATHTAQFGAAAFKFSAR